MKALPFKIPKPLNQALIYEEHHVNLFYDRLHQHEEIQLSLIVGGEGSLIVGDKINHYEVGDILVIGSNLPHVFKSEVHGSEKSHMLSLFFKKTSFGEDFFELMEFQELSLFFKHATHGFKITSSKNKISSLFLQFNRSSNFKRFILFLEILKRASSSSYKSLSSFVHEKKYNDLEGKRMHAVFEYTMSNFEKNISLKIIAGVANMTKSAFCKYFKTRTNKTYFNFLNELRTEHACKLILADNDLSIAEVAILSGFRNMSNFNRRFKSLKKTSPLQYKLSHSI